MWNFVDINSFKNTFSRWDIAGPWRNLKKVCSIVKPNHPGRIVLLHTIGDDGVGQLTLRADEVSSQKELTPARDVLADKVFCASLKSSTLTLIFTFVASPKGRHGIKRLARRVCYALGLMAAAHIYVLWVVLCCGCRVCADGDLCSVCWCQTEGLVDCMDCLWCFFGANSILDLAHACRELPNLHDDPSLEGEMPRRWFEDSVIAELIARISRTIDAKEQKPR